MPSLSSACLSAWLPRPQCLTPGIRGTSAPGQADSQPQPQPSNLLNASLPAEPRVTGRASSPAWTPWVLFGAPDFLPTPGGVLPDAWLQDAGKPLRKGQRTHAEGAGAASPRSLGCQADVCTHTATLTPSRCLWLRVHRDQLHQHSSSKSTLGTSGHPFFRTAIAGRYPPSS